jgi:hypothetical protein
MLDAELHTGAATAPQVLPPKCSLGPPQSSYLWTAADARVHHGMHRLSRHSFTGSNSCRSTALRLCIAGVYCVDPLFCCTLLSVGITHAYRRRAQLAMVARACSALCCLGGTEDRAAEAASARASRPGGGRRAARGGLGLRQAPRALRSLRWACGNTPDIASQA